MGPQTLCCVCVCVCGMGWDGIVRTLTNTILSPSLLALDSAMKPGSPRVGCRAPALLAESQLEGYAGSYQNRRVCGVCACVRT